MQNYKKNATQLHLLIKPAEKVIHLFMIIYTKYKTSTEKYDDNKSTK